ncbi:hypothetical protein ACFQZE_07020 [Paenibacillus sp. GCM10027627]|uniref:hypothetical protein n=1 Tax=unclassified Paenibacillus TaxID=185978 RepID=UPI003639D675
MSLVDFANNELRVKLSFFQLDVLELLERDPDAWQRKLKPTTFEIKQVMDIYSEWENRNLNALNC